MIFPNNSPDKLLFAIVQSQDADSACDALTNIDTITFQLPSTGAFLGLQNKTLLIHSAKMTWKTIVQALRKTCKQRIEYLPINIDGMMTSTGSFSNPVAIGGATIFAIDIERFEEM
jgi:uncharacterized protein YaaQ